MKRRWMPLVGVLFTAMAANLTTLPAHAYDQFDDVMLGAYSAVNSASYDCECMPAETVEERSAASYAAAVGTDAAWQRYTVFWLSRPDYLQAGVKGILDLAAKDEQLGYLEEAKYYRAMAATMVKYSVPAIDVAAQRGQNSTFLHYAKVAVNGDQVTVTPNYANVAVNSAALANGVVNATIQVTDTVSSAIYSYAYATITVQPTPPPAPTPKAFTKTYPPSISGHAAVGQTLTAKVKTWKPSEAKDWQWQRNGVDISGATGYKYKLTAADLGTVITVKLTGSRSGYNSLTKVSKTTKVVAKGKFTIKVKKPGGTTKVGRVLTARVSVTSGSTLAYQWYRNGKAISGATGRTYVLAPSDLGKKLTVKVWATKPGYYSPKAKTSSKTSKIRKGDIGKVTPTIAGTPQVGQVLTVNPGAWKPEGGVTFTYQWYRNGKAIRGATGASLTLTSADLGKTLKVKVTGKSAGYNTTYRYSPSTSKVVNPPPPDPTPAPTPSVP